LPPSTHDSIRPGLHAARQARITQQDIELANVSQQVFVCSGSFASLRRAATLRRMSAMPSIATESVRHNEPTPCARNRHMHRSKLHHYSITPSARNRNDSGIVSLSALAVVKLITRSNFLGCSTGMSPGFAPRRILST